MDSKTFEENILELEKIVKELESGDTPLEEAIDKYTEAMKLSKLCDDKLKEVSNKINKIVNKDGEEVEFNIETN